MSLIDSSLFLKKSKSQKELASLCIIIGEEESTVEECLKSVQSVFFSLYGSGNSDFNLEILHGDRDEAPRIMESCQTLPLGTPKKLVILKHSQKLSDDSINQMVNYCSNPNPATSLVFLWHAKPNQATLNKTLPAQIIENGVAVKCWKPYDDRMADWVIEQFRESGKKVSYQAAALLAEEGGKSLKELKSEIEKCILFMGEKEEAGLSEIKKILSFGSRWSLWDFTENLQSGKNKEAGKILEHCLESGAEPIRVLNLIIWNRRKKFKESSAENAGNIRRANELFRELKRSDLMLKSGQGTESSVFERLVYLCGRG